MLGCCHCFSPDTYLDLKSLIPLISPIIVIILFIIDRWMGFNLRSKEVDRNWYFKVLIEPSVEKITDFYHNTNELYRQASELLIANSGIPHSEFNALKAQEFSKFQESKRIIEAEIILPILTRYPSIGDSLTITLLDLEDNFTTSLDSENFSNDDIVNFYRSSFANRASLLNKLYSPIQNNSNGF